MSKDTPARRTLADVIMEKIKDKKTEIESQMSGMIQVARLTMLLIFCRSQIWLACATNGTKLLVKSVCKTVSKSLF